MQLILLVIKKKWHRGHCSYLKFKMKYVILLLFNCTVGQRYAVRCYVAITGSLGEDVCESSGEKAMDMSSLSV